MFVDDERDEIYYTDDDLEFDREEDELDELVFAGRIDAGYADYCRRNPY